MKTWKHAIIGIIALFALAFISCPTQDDNGKTDNVQRQFTINGTFYRTMNGTLTPYSATITVIDQTSGSVNLAEQGMIAKLEQVFANVAEDTKTNMITEQSAYIVLPRGVKINIVNAGEAFNGFQALNSNTVRGHIDFLTSTNDTLIAVYVKQILSVLASIVHV